LANRYNYVSLWIGSASNQELLDEYVEVEYDEDGECYPSKFLIDFEIDINDFDEDFIEAVYKEKCVHNIKELINDCSYSQDIILKFESIYKMDFGRDINSAILVYNYKFKTKKEKKDGLKFEYIGSVEFEY
jgi:hypothetical protein